MKIKKTITYMLIFLLMFSLTGTVTANAASKKPLVKIIYGYNVAGCDYLTALPNDEYFISSYDYGDSDGDYYIDKLNNKGKLFEDYASYYLEGTYRDYDYGKMVANKSGIVLAIRGGNELFIFNSKKPKSYKQIVKYVYKENRHQYFRDIVSTKDGGFLVLMIDSKYDVNGRESATSYLRKYNSKGKRLWKKKIGTTNDSDGGAIEIQPTNNGKEGYVVIYDPCKYTENGKQYKYKLLFYNSKGKKLKSIAAKDAFPNSIVYPNDIDNIYFSNDRIIIIGSKILLYDFKFKLKKTIDIHNFACPSVNPDGKGGFVLVGHGNGKARVIRINKKGKIIRDIKFGGSGTASFSDAMVTSKGEIVAVGTVSKSSLGTGDLKSCKKKGGKTSGLVVKFPKK